MKWQSNGSKWWWLAMWWMMSMMMMMTNTSTIMAQPNADPPPGMISLQVHRSESSGRRRGLQALDQTALFASSVFLWCGTPPQRRDLGIDTGSFVTAFICQGCNDCGTHFDPPFDQSMSPTFEKVSCDMCTSNDGCSASGDCLDSAAYGGGDGWNGFKAIDQCFFAGDYPSSTVTSSQFSFNLTFSCQTTLIGSFKTTYQDGILGMSNSEISAWAQLQKAGKIQNRMFSICFAPSLELAVPDANQTRDEGTLTLGGSDTRLHNTPLVYSANALSDDIYFHATIRRVYLQGSNATSPSMATILNLNETILNYPKAPLVDSGTQYSGFLPDWLDAFKEAWLSVTGSPFDSGASYATPDEFSGLPTILIQLVGDPSNAAISTTTGLAGSLDPAHPLNIIIAFPPSHYINANGYIPEDESITSYGIYLSFNADQTILGANFMMGNDVFFDVENNRIGWADSNCTYSKLPAATAAPATPTSAPVAPTAVPVAPTATPVTPTAAPVSPTAAPVAPTATPVTPTAAPVSPTAAPVKPTAAPVKPTAAPVKPTAAPVKPTAAPVKPTAAPVTPTAAPVKPTAAPVTPTAAPVTPSAAPVTPSAAPVKPTAAPVKPTAAPVKRTAAPVKPTPEPKKKLGKQKKFLPSERIRG